MSEVKKFKSVRFTNVSLAVTTRKDGLFLKTMQGDDQRDSITIAPSDAPALALTILEAAGYTDSDFAATPAEYFGMAMSNLRAGVEAQAKATAEAEEQAKLEAEALALRNEWTRSEGIQVGNFNALSEISQEKWLAVARKHRELAKEAGE